MQLKLTKAGTTNAAQVNESSTRQVGQRIQLNASKVSALLAQCNTSQRKLKQFKSGKAFQVSKRSFKATHAASKVKSHNIKAKQ
jgi:hypothetical protein